MNRYFIILNFSFLMISCSMFDHRDHSDKMSEFNDLTGPMFVANRDFDVVAGDTGRQGRTMEEVYGRTPITQTEMEKFQYANSLKGELVRLENQETEENYNQYLSFYDKLGNDSNRIYYLQLSPSERISYLRAKGIIETLPEQNYAQNPQPQRMPAGQQNAQFAVGHMITLGMSKEMVLDTWGKPDRRDVAGNPRYENERWVYSNGRETKYLYFENGRVEGWSEQ